MSDKLVVSIADVEADSERLDELTLALRRELLELDVDDVERLSAGQAPVGTRGFDVATVGALLVTLSSSASAVGSLITTVRGWLMHAPAGRSVELAIGDKSIKLSGATNEQQERLIHEFLRSVATS
ncbi:MAG: hypothetical protein M3Q87_05695 [Actinomycetota bacterium]|nr:hypothetical protein [Actinomycetota bacterium]